MVNSSIEYDLIILTETWLDENFRSSELFPPGYNVYRCDRDRSITNKKTRGGVIIAVRSCHRSSLLLSSATCFEQLFVQVILDKRRILVGGTYFIPASSESVYTEYIDTLNMLVSKYTFDDFLLTGDFNLPDCTWNYTNNHLVCDCKHSSIPVRTSSNMICNALDGYNLKQLNTFSNQSNNTLDLIFTSFDKYKSCISLDPLSKIDVLLESFDISLIVSKSIPLKFEVHELDFRKADYCNINRELSTINWDALFAGKSIDDLSRILHTSLIELINKHTPPKKKHDNRFPTWYSRKLISCIIQKKHCTADSSSTTLKSTGSNSSVSEP